MTATRAPSPRAAFALTGVIHTAYALLGGLHRGADTASYSLAGDLLVRSGFDYPSAFARMQGSTYPPAMYVVFATLVAGLKVVLGARWEVGLVVLNVLAVAGVAALLASLARRATGSAAAGWCALGLFLVCADFQSWTPYVLSDATFFFLSFLVFALAAGRIMAGEGSWIPVFALAAAVAWYRPTGVVLLPSALWAFYLARSRPGRLRKTATALGVAAMVAGTWTFAWIMQRPERWPVHALTQTVATTAVFYAQGEVVYDRPETFHAPPSSVPQFAAVAGDRTLHFFAPAAATFSRAHALVNALFYLPAYLLVAVLLAAMARGQDGLSERQRDVFLAAMTFVLVTAVFHGLLQVDFDWRYRAPILPHLALLAAGGASVVLRRVRG